MNQKARRYSLIGSFSLICLGLLLSTVDWEEPNREISVASTKSTGRASHAATRAEVVDLPAAHPPGLAEPPNPLRKALAMGIPLRVSIPDPVARESAADEFDLYVRPMRALADQFQVSLGADFDRTLKSDIQVFEGWAVSPNSGSRNGRTTLALVNGSLGAVIRGEDGGLTELKTDPETGHLLALRLDRIRHSVRARPIRTPGGAVASMTSDAAPFSEDDWLAAEIAPQWGGDPATGEITKYEQPIPNGSLYDLSLPEATVMVVLAKDATGSNSATNLASLASTYIARMANVATIWENQLGIRLLVSELILTPDTTAYQDVGDTLDDFRLWGETNRPRTQYPRSVAVRFGNLGFEGNVIGEAFLRVVKGSAGYNVNKTNYNFTLVAHEMGHNFGTDHSSGGIMNSSHQSGQRDFFRDVSAGETAAKDIYDHAKSRLFGPATMRHAEELPFARDDSITTQVNTPLVIEPLANDDPSVPNGATNTLTIAEVSRVYPIDAGTAESTGASEILFTPSDGFEGFAWFSYSLQGSVGNGSQGWLHRGDVAVLVGSDPTDPLNITLAPGESVIFDPPGSGSASIQTPAAQALVDVTRDDSKYLVIRAQADAAGSDSFVVRRGSLNYTINITYEARLPSSAADVVIADTGPTAVRFNPMSNDDAVGYRRPLQLGARTGVDGLFSELLPERLAPRRSQQSEPGKRIPDPRKDRHCQRRIQCLSPDRKHDLHPKRRRDWNRTDRICDRGCGREPGDRNDLGGSSRP